MIKLIHIIFIILVTGNLFAETPKEIIENLFIFGNGPNMYINVTMDIHSSRGAKTRTIEAAISRNSSEIKVLLKITAPAFLNKMKFLSHKNRNGIENRWLSTSRGVRKLSDANRSENIFDSDFTVEDFSVLNVRDFSLNFGPSEKIGTKQCIVIIAVPVVQGYSCDKKKFYINNNLLWGIDYLNKDDVIIKKYRVYDTMQVEGHLYPKECEMRTFDGDTWTILHFNSIKSVNTIPSRIFSRANL